MIKTAKTKRLGLLVGTTIMLATPVAAQISLDGLFGGGGNQTTTQPAQTQTPSPQTQARQQVQAANADAASDFEAFREMIRSEVIRLSRDALEFEEGEVGAQPLTVQDIDQERRRLTSERNRAQLERNRSEVLQSRIELMLLLKDVVDALDEGQSDAVQQQAAAEPQVDVNQLRRQWELEQRQRQRAAEEQARNEALGEDRDNLPSLVRIEGAGGQLRATFIDANGVRSEWMVGETMANGFVLESVNERHARVRSQNTNEEYTLSPTAVGGGAANPTRRSQTRTVDQGGPGQDQNMQGQETTFGSVEDFISFSDQDFPSIPTGPGSGF